MGDGFSKSNILIRPYRVDDVPALFEAVRESVAELSVWMPWCTPSYSIKDSETWVTGREAEWNDGTHYSFVIVERGSERFLGGVGLNSIRRDHHFANLGYWVRTSAAGRGAASAATILTAQFGFQTLNLNRIEIVAAVGNRASQRAAGKAGARYEGVLRKRLLINNVAHDAAMFSFVAEDFESEFGQNS